MTSPGKFLRRLALAFVAALAPGVAAQADPTLAIQIGSNVVDASDTVLTNNNDGTWTFTGGFDVTSGKNVVDNSSSAKYSFTITISDNEPGTPGLAQLMDETSEIRSSATAAPNNIYITVTESAFTAPTGTALPLSGTLNVTQDTTSDTIGFSGKVVGGSTISGPNLSAPGSWTHNSISTTTAPFSLQTTLTFLTTAGSDDVATGSLTLAPEPSTAGLVFAGFVTLGLHGWRQRRMKRIPA